MARQSLQTTYADFREGWVNTANPLQQPEGSVKDIVNFDIDIDGTLTKRSGLELVGEPSYSTPAYNGSFLRSPTVYVWKNVGEDANRTFLVMAISFGETGSAILYFYDISSGTVSLTLDNYVSAITYGVGVTAKRARKDSFKKISMTSAFGRLFVASTSCEPIMVGYNEATGNPFRVELNIKIRDTELWYGPDDESTGMVRKGGSLDPWHHYNLLNSGWIDDVVSVTTNAGSFRSNAGRPILATKFKVNFWPKVSELYSASKSGGGGNIPEITAYNPWTLSNQYAGNTVPPLGRFIKETSPFVREGKIASSAAAYTGEVHTETQYLSEWPSNINFYAGRLWYLSNGEYVEGTSSTGRPISELTGGLKVYYSQMFKDSFNKASNCYQENDPTDEEINQLLATDGGVLSIKEAGSLVGSVVLNTSLMILTDKGIWSVAGSDLNSFDPTAFSIDKVLDVPIKSSDNYVVNNGVMYLITEEGLFRLSGPTMSSSASYEDLSSAKIKNFFNSLSARTIRNALLRYDKKRNLLFCFLNVPEDNTAIEDYKYNTVIIFNENIGAFYKYKISLPSDYLLIDAVFSEDQEVTFSINPVVDSLEEQIVNSLGEDIVLPGEASFLPTDTTLQLILFDTSISKLRVATFTDSTNFEDFGIPYTAYVDIGYDSLSDIVRDSKQAPYITSKLVFDFQGFEGVEEPGV